MLVATEKFFNETILVAERLASKYRMLAGRETVYIVSNADAANNDHVYRGKRLSNDGSSNCLILVQCMKAP